MLRRAGLFGLALAFTGCTERIVIDDGRDGGSSDVVARDAWPTADGPCGTGATYYYQNLSPVPKTVQLLVLLDRSTSMESSFAGTTREAAAQAALITAIKNYQTKVQFGLVQFPADPAEPQCGPDSCCAGPVSKPALYNLGAMTSSMQCSDPQSPGCQATIQDSPSYAALAAALALVRDSLNPKDPKANDSSVDHYVLLVTSTEPSCAADSQNVCANALNAAGDLNNAGVNIAVLSVGYQPIPGSCLYRISQYGSSWATDLSTTSWYTANSLYDLSNAVNGFVLAVAQSACTVNINPAPNWAQLFVSIGSKTYQQTDGTNQDGWAFASPARASITLSGSACTDFVNSPGKNQLSVGYYYCPGPYDYPQP